MGEGVGYMPEGIRSHLQIIGEWIKIMGELDWVEDFSASEERDCFSVRYCGVWTGQNIGIRVSVT